MSTNNILKNSGFQSKCWRASMHYKVNPSAELDVSWAFYTCWFLSMQSVSDPNRTSFMVYQMYQYIHQYIYIYIYIYVYQLGTLKSHSTWCFYLVYQFLEFSFVLKILGIKIVCYSSYLGRKADWNANPALIRFYHVTC